MPRKLYPNDPKCTVPSFDELLKPTESALATAQPLVAKGNRPLQMNFEQQLRALVYFHLEEHTSGRHLIQALEEDDTSPAITLRLLMASKRAAFSKPSTVAALNS